MNQPCTRTNKLSLRILYVRSTSKFSLEQRHDLISTTFQLCSNVRCPLGCVDSPWKNATCPLNVALLTVGLLNLIGLQIYKRPLKTRYKSSKNSHCLSFPRSIHTHIWSTSNSHKSACNETHNSDAYLASFWVVSSCSSWIKAIITSSSSPHTDLSRITTGLWEIPVFSPADDAIILHIIK